VSDSIRIACLDLEGVLVPEIWIAFAEKTGIAALRRTTRDEPDYDVLMKGRLRILAEHGLGLPDIQRVIGELRPLEAAYADALAPRRFIAVVLTTFAAVGLLVAGVGLYGLVAMSVAGRARELGIRIALGTSWAGIRRMVLGEAALVVGVGTLAGGLTAALATRLLQNQLVGVDSLDATTWMATVAILAAAGLGAAWIPARRAAGVDPIDALRQE